jgi:glucose-1-phosphate thymidylyltransferase
MKGIILAGGHGTRLYPATLGVSKQLIPVYDKPMIYYPLSVLMLAQIKEVAIITTREDQRAFQNLLGDGTQWGMKFEYIAQLKPEGLAQAFILAEDFLEGEDACLILGDNIFYGHGLLDLLAQAKTQIAHDQGACVFGYTVRQPERYGVVEFNSKGDVISIEEKPKQPKSHYAITGLYFYDHEVCQLAKTIRPSARGELEITCLNRLYLERQQLRVKLMGRGYAWLDTGTHESMMQASQFVAAVEDRQGLKIGCVEEVAFNNGWIDKEKLLDLSLPLQKTQYGQYLQEIVKSHASDRIPNTVS